jgi:hypothetical protein
MTTDYATPQPVGEMREIIARKIHAEAEEVRKKYGEFTVQMPPYDALSGEDKEQLMRYGDIAIAALASTTDGEVRESVERLMNAAWMNGEAVEGGRKNEGADITEAKREVLALFASRTLVPATTEGGSHAR